jgi:hypothetical protein
MLGPRVNPQARNLFGIIRYLQKHAGVELHVASVPARGQRNLERVWCVMAVLDPAQSRLLKGPLPDGQLPCFTIQEWCGTDWPPPTLSDSTSDVTPQAGAPSGYCGSPSLSVSHACLLEVQMCSVGWKSSGASKLPHVRPMTPALARSVNNEVPQTVQKPRTRTGEELRRPSAPVIVTAFKGISTRALNAAPSDR